MLLKRHLIYIANSVGKVFAWGSLKLAAHNESLYVGHSTSVETRHCVLQRQSSRPQTTTHWYNPQKLFNDFRICSCPYWETNWDSIKVNWRDIIVTQNKAIIFHLNNTLSNVTKSIFFSLQDKCFNIIENFPSFLGRRTTFVPLTCKRNFAFLFSYRIFFWFLSPFILQPVPFWACFKRS
jgi:hypothetical protein